MKWDGFKIQSWDELWKALMSITIIIIIIFMLADFINWKLLWMSLSKTFPQTTAGYHIIHFSKAMAMFP